MKHLSTLSLVACTLLALTGCGAQPIPTTAPPPQETPPPPVIESETTPSNDLMTEWLHLADSDLEHIDYERAIIIGNELSLQKPDGLAPLFDVIENPDTTPMAKMLAVASLAAHITDNHASQLIALTDAKYDQVTRGCAIHLLGNCLSAEAFFKVRDLIQDPNVHVSKVAAMVTLRKGDEQGLPQILAIWDNPDTPNRDREEIVLGMPPAIALKNMRLFTESICNDGLSNTARSRAIQLLGDVATAEVLPAMKACLEKETDPALHDLLGAAIALIEKREAEGISAVPINIPAGMDLVFQPKPDPSTDTAEENVPTPEPEQNN